MNKEKLSKLQNILEDDQIIRTLIFVSGYIKRNGDDFNLSIAVQRLQSAFENSIEFKTFFRSITNEVERAVDNKISEYLCLISENNAKKSSITYKVDPETGYLISDENIYNIYLNTDVTPRACSGSPYYTTYENTYIFDGDRFQVFEHNKEEGFVLFKFV